MKYKFAANIQTILSKFEKKTMASDNLSFFTQRNHPQWAVVDVKAAIEQAVKNAQNTLNTQQSICQAKLPESQLLTFGDANWISMAITNLVVNAIEHSPTTATIKLVAQKVEQTIEINVYDQGPGVSPGVEYKIFKPFYTTRPGATGLGLANVRTVMEKHGGGIRVGNHHQGGAIFTLILQSIQRQKAA